jgi:hypothetical protein
MIEKTLRNRFDPEAGRYCFTGAEVLGPVLGEVVAPAAAETAGGKAAAEGAGADLAAGFGGAGEGYGAGSATMGGADALGAGAGAANAADLAAGFGGAGEGYGAGSAAMGGAEAMGAAPLAPSAMPTPSAQVSPTSPVTGMAPGGAPEAPVAPGGETPGLPPSAQEGAGYITPQQAAPPPAPATPAGVPGAPAPSTIPYSGPDVVPNVGAPAAASPATGIAKALQSLGIVDAAGNMGKNVLPLLGLGTNAIAQSRMGSTLSKSLTQAGQRSGAAADQLLGQGLSGQAPQAVVAQANQTYQATVEQIKQQYANMGRDPRTDTGAIAAMNKAAVARDAQIQQYAQGLTSQGLQAAQIAQTPATQAAMAAAQQDQQLMAAQREVMDRLSKLQTVNAGTASGG